MLSPKQNWKQRDSGCFTSRKYRKPQSDNHSEQYYDDGKCEICGGTGKNLLIHEAFPRMCKECYDSVRVYKTCEDVIDKLGLRRKRELTAQDMKKIVNFIKGLASLKHIPFAIFVGGLLGTLANRRN